MLTKIRSFIASPLFDDDDWSLKASSLNLGLRVALVVTLFYGLLLLLLHTDNRAMLAMLGTGAMLEIIALTLLRMRKTQLAATFTVSTMWALFTFHLATAEGIRGMSVIGQVVVVFLSGLMVSGRAAQTFAVLSILADLGIYLAERQGLLDASGLMGLSPSRWVLQSLYLITAAVFVSLANRRFQKTLAEAEENAVRYQALFDRTNDAVFIMNLDLTVQQVNQQAAALLGYEPVELIGLPVDSIAAPQEKSDVNTKASRIMDGELVPVYERNFVRKDGSLIPVEVNAALVYNKDGAPKHIQSIVRDISERKSSERRLKHSLEHMEILSRTDSLTGLLNRRAISERVMDEIESARYLGETVSLLMLDLDFLKQINDEYGHLIGDTAICILAERIKQCVRQEDSIGRWGGDEFLIVLPGISEKHALEIAERLRKSIGESEINFPGGDALKMTISVGVRCMNGKQSLAMDKVLNQVDAALYRAKENGRNRVEVHREVVAEMPI